MKTRRLLNIFRMLKEEKKKKAQFRILSSEHVSKMNVKYIFKKIKAKRINYLQNHNKNG